MNTIEIDELTQRSLRMEVFNWLPYAAFIVRQKEKNYLSLALDQVYALHTQYGDRILDGLNAIYEQTRTLAKYTLSNSQTSISYTSIIWEIVYLLTFYLHVGDPEWERYLARMKNLITKGLKEESTKGETLVCKYYELRGINPFPTEPIPSSEIQLQPKTQSQPQPVKKSGRPKQVLFCTDQNSTTTPDQMALRQKSIVLSLLAKHKLTSTNITCNMDGKLTKYLLSIYWRWQDLKLIPEDAVLASAYYHFLADTCELPFDVSPKTFSNRMREKLTKREKYPDIWGEVCEAIQK